MYGGDPVFTAEVKCPVCGNVWSQRISADLVGLWCLECKIYLEVRAKFTLENPVQKNGGVVSDNKVKGLMSEYVSDCHGARIEEQHFIRDGKWVFAHYLCTKCKMKTTPVGRK